MSKTAMSLRNCSFCGRHITTGHGIMLIRNDGQIQWTCSSKCKKNARVLKRDPRK
jgi:large subunit ribosomal protein L24e